MTLPYKQEAGSNPHRQASIKCSLNKNKLDKCIANILVLFFAFVFLVKFGRPAILKSYVVTGIGDCQKMPILCIAPEKEIINPAIDETYIQELIPYKFSQLEVCLPKGFTVVNEKVTKVYYKKKWHQKRGAVVYLLYEAPDFFINLFPQAKKRGIMNDYEFLNRTMYAKIKDINNLTDTFFVIMKTVFTPYMSDQKNIKIIKFSNIDNKGFITYKLSPLENYFDCNVINQEGDFFKVYIKDKGARLDLDKVIAIVSTIKKQP